MNAVMLYLERSDERVVRALARVAPPMWVCRALVAATSLGNFWIWPSALALAVLAPSPAAVGRALAVAAALVNPVVYFLKSRVRRRRPGRHLPNPVFRPIPERLVSFDRFSFPSGHTANAFASAVVLAVALPLASPLWLSLALAIALSRLWLGQHYLSDVIVGGVIGSASGLVAGLALLGR
jgi:undecaprenyl-diphosphatase